MTTRTALATAALRRIDALGQEHAQLRRDVDEHRQSPQELDERIDQMRTDVRAMRDDLLRQLGRPVPAR